MLLGVDTLPLWCTLYLENIYVHKWRLGVQALGGGSGLKLHKLLNEQLQEHIPMILHHVMNIIISYEY